MPNTFFRFRQFTVNQDRCAMKVCTDACLFGAWIASLDKMEETFMLDIGAGTGLLSLMAAQSTSATIHAVEIDGPAFEQASENFKSSPWSDRLIMHHSSLQSFFPGVLYDFIFSNPPFFDNDLKAATDQKNLALHSSALSLEELLASVKRLLRAGGEFATLLPFHRSNYFESILTANGFYIRHKVFVKQTPSHEAFRCMYLLANLDNNPVPANSEIIIKDENNLYTKEFYTLLKNYYLFENKNMQK